MKRRMTRNRKQRGTMESRVMEGLSLNMTARLRTVVVMVLEKWRITMPTIIRTFPMSAIILAMRSPR